MLLLVCAVRSLERIEISGWKERLESGKRVVTNISWTEVPNTEYYLLFKRKRELNISEREMLSTFNFEDNETLRILNVYPSEEGRGSASCSQTIPGASLVFSNGTSQTVPMSQKSGSKVAPLTAPKRRILC